MFPIECFGQKDTRPTIDAYEAYETKYLKGKNGSDYELTKAQNETKEQKIYRNIISACLGVLLILLIFVIYLFVSKSKHVNEIIKIQNREIKLRQTQLAQLSLILNNIKSTVVILSKNGEIKWMNKTFEKFYGYSIDILMENNKGNYINDLLTKQEKTYMNKCINSKTNFSYIVDTKDTDFKLQRNFIIIKDDKGGISGIAVTEDKIFQQSESESKNIEKKK